MKCYGYSFDEAPPRDEPDFSEADGHIFPVLEEEPDDMDDFWEEAIEELCAIEPEYEEDDAPDDFSPEYPEIDETFSVHPPGYFGNWDYVSEVVDIGGDLYRLVSPTSSMEDVSSSICEATTVNGDWDHLEEDPIPPVEDVLPAADVPSTRDDSPSDGVFSSHGDSFGEEF